METLHIILLALMQGLTEFLPISSSAHLILPKEILGWPDQGLAFDVAVHLGSLFAVLIFFYRDIKDIFLGLYGTLQHRQLNKHSQLAFCLVIATIPVCVCGLVFNDYIESSLRSIVVIAATTIIFGILLGIADKCCFGKKNLYQIGFYAALIIGLAQCLALIPGTSRSGITITAALFLGFYAKDAAKFSFLMSIPVIFLGALFKLYELISLKDGVEWHSLGLGILISGVSAYLCIKYFLAFIERIGMMPFVIYRLLLGALLIWLTVMSV